MKTQPLQLLLYTKPNCPLCDEAKVVLDKLSTKLHYIDVVEIDITKNLQLFTKYKLQIPVLELDGKQFIAQQIDVQKLVWHLRWNRFWKRFVKN
ncbi:MAG: glutaredoxin family protein [Candidatus Poribacteria bacterium]|nr:glutaredoxin family protein [Candidatus Poribacteria bacterium]